MATVDNQSQCAACRKTTTTLRYVGYLRDFCFRHLDEHCQQLEKHFDEIEEDRGLFEQVNQWEDESIQKIKQTAQEIRKTLLVHIDQNRISVKDRVNQLRVSREQDSITENRLNKWREELEQLTQEIDKPSNIAIQQTELSLINKIQIRFSGK